MEDYTVASTDLTNFYFLVSMDTIAKNGSNARLKTNHNTNMLASASGFIGNGAIPYGTDPTISLIWYAFASGCYFQNDVKEDFIYGVTPFRNVGFYSQDFRVSAQWELESAAPFLPKNITFTGDYKFLNGKRDPNVPESLVSTDCVYRVLEFTNVDSLTLPRRGMAEFPCTNKIHTTFSFVVTGVSKQSVIPDFVVRIPSKALISDYRPISTTASIAVPTGPVTEWPQLNVTKSAYQRLLNTQKINAPQNPEARGFIVRVCLIIFIIGSGILGLFVIFTISRSSKPNV